MAEQKKILIIAFTELKSNKRAVRQIEYFKEKYEIHSVGFGEFSVKGVSFHPVIPLFQSMDTIKKMMSALFFLTGRFKVVYPMLYDYKQALAELKKIKFDLIIVHDIKPFPLVEQVDPDAKILCDAHEFYYDQVGFSWIDYFLLGRFDKYLLKKYFLQQKHLTTVSDWIADQYRRRMNTAVDVILSSSDYTPLEPVRVNGGKIRIIHHGIADPNRKLELMIKTAEMLDERFEFHLMLTTTTFGNSYLKVLAGLCEGKKNIKLIPPVEPSEIVNFINQYDIGFYILPDLYLNSRYALPNKFFEFIQARLMLAISPNPEMAKWIKKYDLGIVFENYDPSDIAKMINGLTAEKIWYYKNQSNKYAREFSSESQMSKLEGIVENLVQ